MIDPLVVLISALLGGCFAVLVAITTSLCTHWRDQHKVGEEFRRERYERVATLYTDALYLLEKTIRQGGIGDTDLANGLTNMVARLDLFATPEIRAQYEKAGVAIDVWAEEVRRAHPDRCGKLLLVVSWQLPHGEKARELYAPVEKEMAALKLQMQEHLAKIEWS